MNCMAKEKLIGAVRRGNESSTTYFYQGIGNAKLEAVAEVCYRTGLQEKVEENRVICIAVETNGEPYHNGKYVGIAYRCKNGRISLMTTDKFRSDYLKIYVQEMMEYYDGNRKGK